MGKHEKTKILIEEMQAILALHNPMTLRQVFYRLVSRQVVENDRGRYQAVSDALVRARKEKIIPWEWVEDRLREPRQVSMWDGIDDFSDVVNQYRRNVWEDQLDYVEVWLEKDALSGIFKDVLEPYGVTLNVGRGYDGWHSIHRAAERYKYEGRGDVTVLYFGDFDPSGEDMVRSLKERLTFFEVYPEIIKCALTLEDIQRYNLPPDFTKKTDTRRKKFVEKYGDISVELDALPIDVLRDRIISEIESRMDMKALVQTKETEEEERRMLENAFRSYGS